MPFELAEHPFTAQAVFDGRVTHASREALRATIAVDPVLARAHSGDLVLVGNTRGRVIAVERATGRELWRASVSSEVLAPPAADWDVVVVQTLDGKVTGLDAATGARRWTHDSSNPLVTLRGTVRFETHYERPLQ